MASPDKTIVLITGANTGIGLETVRALVKSPKAARPYHILLGSRNLQRGQDAAALIRTENPDSQSSVEPVQIDITDDESVEKLVNHIKETFGRLDVLINNAGASFDALLMPSIKTARALWMHTYDVNVAATHGLTVALAPLLVASTAPNGARLIFLTSGLSSLTGAHARPSPAVASPDAIPPGWPKPMERLFMGYAYRAAKVALNMCMLHWFHLLHSDGVKVWAVSPGFLATCLMGSGNEALMRKMGAREPSIGGEAMRGVVEGERDGQVGLVVTGDGAVQEW